jgi:HSP20 family protein
MELIRWDPYRDMRSFQDRFNRAFGLTRSEREEEMNLGSWIPPVDISEDKEKIVLTAELPGFKEDQLDVQLENGILTIRGERKMEEEKDGKNYHRVERSYGHFVRSFTLPNNVDRENVQARFENGLLHVEVPKREEAKPRQIKVAGEGRKKEIDVKSK